MTAQTPTKLGARLSRLFQLHEDSRAYCPAVPVLVGELRPTGTEVFVHVNFMNFQSQFDSYWFNIGFSGGLVADAS